MSLHIISAPMFSGKTTNLLFKLSQEVAIYKKALYINHSIDTRSENAFSSHNPLLKDYLNLDGLTMKKYEYLPELNDILEYDVIGIDEFSFFTNYQNVLHYVEKGHKKVIITGLLSDYNRQTFGHILDLIPYCDSYTQLYAYCTECAKNGLSVHSLFTHRLVTTTDQIDIGAHDKYIPLCRQHYLDLNK